MCKARRKGFTFIPDVPNEIQFQSKVSDMLTKQYDVDIQTLRKMIKEVFDEEQPQQRLFFYWTEEHYKEFDRAMKDYIKNKEK